MINLKQIRQRLDDWYHQKAISAPVKLLMLPYCVLYDYLEKHTRILPIVIEKVNLILTPRCTLRCRKCCNLMPYHRKPVDFTFDEIVQDISSFLALTKKIKCLQLIGGEPLLFKDLPKLLKILTQESKIKRILLVTNGTIIPSDELLAALKHHKISVIISNYVRLNTKINEVYSLCRQNNINVHIEGLVWFDMQFGPDKQRSYEENQKIFTECYRECHEIFNGEYHLCSRSSNATFIGMIERCADDYVNIRHNGTRTQIKQTRQKLRLLLQRTEHITACKHCMGNRPENTVIPDAEQLPVNTYLDFDGNIVQK